MTTFRQEGRSRSIPAAFADRLRAATPAPGLCDSGPWRLTAEPTSRNAGLHATGLLVRHVHRTVAHRDPRCFM
ncbi:hypothetical protein GCM10010231_14940 [Streptomyces sindenensis]|nr:hypothetical protein GCM10010231_14940 [Streptomyces sindenensis]